MKRKWSEQKKKRLELVILLALVLALVAVIAVDVLLVPENAPLSEEDATALLRQTLESLPMTGATAIRQTVEEMNVSVTGVEESGTREYIVHVGYTSKNILPLYEKRKNELFSEAYGFYTETQGKGEMINSAKIRQHLTEQIVDLVSEAETVDGQIDLYVYEITKETASGDALAKEMNGTVFRIYTDDALIDALFGGLRSVQSDILSTTTLEYEGKTVDLSKINTLRTGISECFGMYAYKSEKPDATHSGFVAFWNNLKYDFHRNFIQDARWTFLAKGLLTTLELTLLSALFGVLIGFLCAIVRVTHDKTGALMIPDQIVRLYLTVIRGTPVMVQLLIIYFVLLLPIGIEKFPAAVLCFSFNSGAYVCEIIRGGIMSVDNGQMEAGRSLGLNYIQTMTYIVTPQAFKAVLPALVNEFIALLKETSVAFYIGVADLTQAGIKIRSVTYSNFLPLIAVALIYLIVVLILTKLVGLLEKQLRRSER